MPIICKCSRGCSQARRTYVDETPSSQIKSGFVFHHLIHKILVQLPSCCTKTCSTTKRCVSLLILELEYDQHLLCNYSYTAVLLLYREEDVYICCRISLMNHDGILFHFSLSRSLSRVWHFKRYIYKHQPGSGLLHAVQGVWLFLRGT